jgi:hypothetical protein
MLDQLQEIVGLHTLTATETSQPFVVLPYGAVLASPGGVKIRVQYQDVSLSSGSGTLQFTAKISYDRGATWLTAATGTSITLSTTAQSGEQVLQIQAAQYACDTGVMQVQVLASVGGSPTGATATYRADLI